ncbi:MAG: hypothetical protein BECKG1743D_GA0114223_112541 [Candidatus Kentron sp. G]|nr:MAG: hypothetical protein BECKG1743D_GA0114223_112541 [Candidatus Kentron sp. G]
MDPTDFLNFTDFMKLSSVYGKWLTAIGAVNTTVLALVLTLTKRKDLSDDAKRHYVTLIHAVTSFEIRGTLSHDQAWVPDGAHGRS